MEASPLAHDEEFWQAPEWYRALSLVERLGPRAAAGAIASPPLGAADRALGRLGVWKAQKPFDHGSLFEERLALDALCERDLLELLAEPADSLRARAPGTPDWLAALRDAFMETAAHERLAPLLEQVGGNHPLRACLPALAPLLQRGLSSVEESVRRLRRQHAHLPFDVEALPKGFLAHIAPAILFQVSKPVVLEMHIARLQGQLEGETPQARFAQFMRNLDRKRGMVHLLRKYPVLGRQLVTAIDQWADFLGEFLVHLCVDWETICATFSPGNDPGLLVEIDAGRGDAHRRGRTVLVLRFSSGMQLVYKPKSLAVDVHFQELLSWLNDRGADPLLRPLKLVDRGAYGWSELVPAASCTSRDQVARFYERLGGYLALLYALDGTDLHNENLIAAGENPIIVDLEALFHPHVYGEDPLLAGNLAAGVLNDSVWQVGILPRLVWADEESLGVDMSGLGGQPGQMNPHALVSFDDQGTDDVRVRRRRVELPGGDNRPRLNDQDVEVLNYGKDILAGFTKMYRLLCHHRGALLTEQLPRFARDETRVVVRSSNVYGLLLYESFHPDLLRDALDRDRFFDRLWGEAAQRRYLARVIPAERRDLWRGDIPVFSTSPESRILLTSEGEPLVDVIDAPSLDLVRQRMEKLGEDDLVRQTWIVEASLATLLMVREDAIGGPLQLPETPPPADRDRLLDLADSVGKRVEELASQDDTGAYWLGVGPLGDHAWGLFASGIDLYAGTSGIALFLAYLGAVTGTPSHSVLAKKALAALRPQVRAWLDAAAELQPASYDRPTIGVYDGLASVIYLLAHLGVLWNDPKLWDDAEDLVERLPPLIPIDRELDVLHGSAGCVLALLSLHAVRPSPRALEVAILCGDRLLATAEPMAEGVAWTTLEGEPQLGGFSHGTAGIALALLRLAARSGQERFRECALQALAFDRSLFVPQLGNWADRRVFGRKRDAEETGRPDARGTAPKALVAWCHGAPGIGLGRLGALEHMDDAQVRGEIDVAINATIAGGLDLNHSLCHGALGNLELLLVAAQLLDRPQDHETLAEATALVAASIEANGTVTGVPLGVETPGFMTGLAGIGYELLRLAEPDKVPSALLVNPPVCHPQS